MFHVAREWAGEDEDLELSAQYLEDGRVIDADEYAYLKSEAKNMLVDVLTATYKEPMSAVQNMIQFAIPEKFTTAQIGMSITIPIWGPVFLKLSVTGDAARNIHGFVTGMPKWHGDPRVELKLAVKISVMADALVAKASLAWSLIVRSSACGIVQAVFGFWTTVYQWSMGTRAGRYFVASMFGAGADDDLKPL